MGADEFRQYANEFKTKQQEERYGKHDASPPHPSLESGLPKRSSDPPQPNPDPNFPPPKL